MTDDAKTLNMILTGGVKPAKRVRKPAVKFSVGEDVLYCGRLAVIVGKSGRLYEVECGGSIWPSNGKDLKKVEV